MNENIWFMCYFLAHNSWAGMWHQYERLKKIQRSRVMWRGGIDPIKTRECAKRKRNLRSESKSISDEAGVN